MKFLRLILRNLSRHKLRTVLTTLAVVALVAIFSLIMTVLGLLDMIMEDRSTDVRMLVSERYKLMMPMDRSLLEEIYRPGAELNRRLRSIPGYQPESYNIWHFVMFTTDPEMTDTNLQFFCIAALPEKIAPMTLGMEYLDAQTVQRMKEPPTSSVRGCGILLGSDPMQKLGKKVGDVFRAYAITHRDGTAARKPIAFELEVVAEIPRGNVNAGAGFMDYQYLNDVLEDSKNEFANKVSFAILQADDLKSAEQISVAVDKQIPEVRCETLSSAYARFMEPMKDLLFGVKYILVPAILVVMTVILANTFSLTVRERHTEMAVLKVLGFGGGRILYLVLGESLLVGTLAGLFGSAVTYGLVNHAVGGFNLPDTPPMYVSPRIFLWGPTIGALTALVGAIWPAWTARGVKVSNVFASVT